jgi:arginyl-tRNA synthetase
MMALIRDDLAALGIAHDVFSSERELVAAGAVDAVMATLDERGLLYTGVLEPPKGMKPDDWEERPQLLFRATGFGDDVDRPIRKSDGSWTYFATDLAYHLDKYERGFPALIDVWGADHGGYVKRVAAGVAALTGGAATLDVKICQLVRLLENGEPAKMSKRSGIFVTLRDLVDEVGRDVVRFIMLTRRNDAPLDFDLVKAREQSRDNPVFYVQYAHARSHSVTNMAREAFAGIDLSDEALASADFRHLTDSDELALIKLIAAWPRIVESAAEAHEPHRLAFYLYDLAAAFHALWSKARGEPGLRFVVAGDRQLTLARLALVRAMAGVVASGLRIMGVEPVDELRA